MLQRLVFSYSRLKLNNRVIKLKSYTRFVQLILKPEKQSFQNYIAIITGFRPVANSVMTNLQDHARAHPGVNRDLWERHCLIFYLDKAFCCQKRHLQLFRSE